MNGKSTANLPDYITKYLWDVDLTVLDINQHAHFIIERVLTYGELDEIKQLIKQYTLKKISGTVQNSRRFDARTAIFWQKMLHLQPEQVTALANPFMSKQYFTG